MVFNQTVVLNYHKNKQIFLLCHRSETEQPLGKQDFSQIEIMGLNKLGKTSVCDIQHVKQEIVVNTLPIGSTYVSMKNKLPKKKVETSSVVQQINIQL